jgi:Recombination endonuclease VII.
MVQLRRLWHKMQDRLKKVYNLTFKEYTNMLVTQDFCCAICKTRITNIPKPLFVDHDHKTGKVRGLLCCSCNSGLGLFKDSRYMLHSAIRYLEQHKDQLPLFWPTTTISPLDN